MESIKEEKAKEYADYQYGEMDDPENKDWRIDHQKTMEDFKAGFEAGKQEERKEIIKKINSIIVDSTGNEILYDLLRYVNEIENLSK